MGSAYVVGTFDTKGAELRYVAGLVGAGHPVVTVDLSTSGKAVEDVDVPAAEVARHHPDGADAVFTGDRGSAVGAMAVAFARFLVAREDVAGVIGLGGSGGTGDEQAAATSTTAAARIRRARTSPASHRGRV